MRINCYKKNKKDTDKNVAIDCFEFGVVTVALHTVTTVFANLVPYDSQAQF
jgi:hypothetical protein